MNTQEQAAFDKMREALEEMNCILDGSPATAKYVRERTIGVSTYAALAAAKEVSETMKVTDLGRYAFEPQAAHCIGVEPCLRS